MCRLFGFRSAVNIGVHHSLVLAENALAQQSESNPDGWGIGFYEGASPILRRGLSKAIGEVLKHTKTVKSKLELVEFSGNTCLKVSDSNPDILKDIEERVQKKFSNQLSIQTISQSILIPLN